jgi:hypothetical protein
LTCKRQIAPYLTQIYSSIGDYGNSPEIMNESGNLNFNEALCLYCKIVRNRSFSCVLKKYCGTCRPIPNVSMPTTNFNCYQQGMAIQATNSDWINLQTNSEKYILQMMGLYLFVLDDK